MSQRVDFAPLPGTKPIEYLPKAVMILGEAARGMPAPKAFREFLRMHSLFDKAGYPVLMEFLGLDVEGAAVTLKGFARKLLDETDETGSRRLLAERLVDSNPLLAKYCLEALDTEQGGRLHSTNELYRLITSYVYPGEKPMLQAFKAWVDWAVAAGLLKLVGIRWAIGPIGRELLPRLRALDAEEFLEEEALQAGADAGLDAGTSDSAGGDDAGPVAEDAVGTEVVVDPGRSRAGEAADRAAPAAVEEPPVESRPVSHDEPGTEGDREGDAVVRALSEWFAGFSGASSLSLERVGLDPAQRTQALVFESAVAALLLGRGLDAEVVGDALGAFRDIGLAGSARVSLKSLADLARQRPCLVPAVEAAVYAPVLAEAVTEPAVLTRFDDPAALAWGLWRRMYEPFAPMAPFVMARFLFQMGLVGEALSPACFVPGRQVCLNAFRIGLIDSLHVGDFGRLVEVAVELGTRFGPPDFEAPLAHVHLAFGCAFHCPNTQTCPIPCREKDAFQSGLPRLVPPGRTGP